MEPFGEFGHYMRNALVCLTVAGCAGAKGVRLQDFLPPTMRPEATQQGPEAFRAVLFAMKKQQDEYLKQQAEANKNNASNSGNRTIRSETE